LGPAYKDLSKIENIITVNDISKRTNVFFDADNIKSIQAASDAAIIAGGTTMFEMISLGVPSLVLPTIDHESRLAKYLQQKKVIDCVEADVTMISEQQLRLKINTFIKSHEFRQSLHKHAKQFPIGGGCETVSGIILSLL
jgi:spore coat polysaccharide biosynthesis predicted glycosyltransferase SpsG